MTTPAFFFCQNVSGRNMFSSLFLLQIADCCHQTHTSFRVSEYSLLLHDHHSNDIHSSHRYTHECHDDDFLSEFAHISDISEKYNPVLLLKPVILLPVPCTLNPVQTGRMSKFVIPVYLCTAFSEKVIAEADSFQIFQYKQRFGFVFRNECL